MRNKNKVKFFASPIIIHKPSVFYLDVQYIIVVFVT